jgi:allantoicase
VRLNIFPDGGVARFRVYGQPACDWEKQDPKALHEVSALVSGGRIVAYNDAHFGVPFRLIMPGRGVNMGDGWETRRRREPGSDWCLIELGHAAVVRKIEIDTAHFKGNYPDRVSIQAANVAESTDESLVTQAMFWPELLGEQKMQMDTQHFFEGEPVRDLGPVTHVRVNMFPDGGISGGPIWAQLASRRRGLPAGANFPRGPCKESPRAASGRRFRIDTAPAIAEQAAQPAVRLR